MRRIDLADAGFLLAERRETPMHVGGVNLFTLPDGADEHKFLEGLAGVLRNADSFRKPFGEYVVSKPTGMFWETDDNMDLDYHIRHSALPKPGRYRELFALASRLHSVLLDRNRPLWEIHLIEGLQNRQFAVYNKMHHAAIDGVGAMHITRGMCSTSKSGRINHAPLSMEAYDAYKASRSSNRTRQVKPRESELRAVADAVKQTFDSGTNLVGAMRRFSGAFLGRSGNLAVPWHNVPKTSINTKVSGARRFVAQSWEFDRVKAVCKALDGTLNDIVLAMCSGALRRYLESRNELPRHSLKAMAPVSLREEGDLESANAVGFITADLATNIKDPEKRLRAIQQSMRAGKELLQGLSSREASIFMQLTQLPAVVTSVLGLADKFPAFSTVISNVPGPREQLYWNGARLDGIYPASIVFDGFAMNITLVSRCLPSFLATDSTLYRLPGRCIAGAGRSGRASRGTRPQAQSEAQSSQQSHGKEYIRQEIESRGEIQGCRQAQSESEGKTQGPAQSKSKGKGKGKNQAQNKSQGAGKNNIEIKAQGESESQAEVAIKLPAHRACGRPLYRTLEGIAGLQSALLEADAEPAYPLLRTAVGKAVGNDTAPGFTLQAVITNRSCSGQRLLQITRIQ